MDQDNLQCQKQLETHDSVEHHLPKSPFGWEEKLDFLAALGPALHKNASETIWWELAKEFGRQRLRLFEDWRLTCQALKALGVWNQVHVAMQRSPRHFRRTELERILGGLRKALKIAISIEKEKRKMTDQDLSDEAVVITIPSDSGDISRSSQTTPTTRVSNDRKQHNDKITHVVTGPLPFGGDQIPILARTSPTSDMVSANCMTPSVVRSLELARNPKARTYTGGTVQPTLTDSSSSRSPARSKLVEKKPNAPGRGRLTPIPSTNSISSSSTEPTVISLDEPQVHEASAVQCRRLIPQSMIGIDWKAPSDGDQPLLTNEAQCAPVESSAFTVPVLASQHASSVSPTSTASRSPRPAVSLIASETSGVADTMSPMLDAQREDPPSSSGLDTGTALVSSQTATEQIALDNATTVVSHDAPLLSVVDTHASPEQGHLPNRPISARNQHSGEVVSQNLASDPALMASDKHVEAPFSESPASQSAETGHDVSVQSLITSDLTPELLPNVANTTQDPDQIIRNVSNGNLVSQSLLTQKFFYRCFRCSLVLMVPPDACGRGPPYCHACKSAVHFEFAGSKSHKLVPSLGMETSPSVAMTDMHRAVLRTPDPILWAVHERLDTNRLATGKSSSTVRPPAAAVDDTEVAMHTSTLPLERSRSDPAGTDVHRTRLCLTPLLGDLVPPDPQVREPETNHVTVKPNAQFVEAQGTSLSVPQVESNKRSFSQLVLSTSELMGLGQGAHKDKLAKMGSTESGTATRISARLRPNLPQDESDIKFEDSMLKYCVVESILNETSEDKAQESMILKRLERSLKQLAKDDLPVVDRKNIQSVFQESFYRFSLMRGLRMEGRSCIVFFLELKADLTENVDLRARWEAILNVYENM